MASIVKFFTDSVKEIKSALEQWNNGTLVVMYPLNQSTKQLMIVMIRPVVCTITPMRWKCD